MFTLNLENYFAIQLLLISCSLLEVFVTPNFSLKQLKVVLVKVRLIWIIIMLKETRETIVSMLECFQPEIFVGRIDLVDIEAMGHTGNSAITYTYLHIVQASYGIIIMVMVLFKK